MKVKNWDKIKLNIDRNRDSNRDNPLAGRVFPYFSLKMHLFQERRVQSLYIELVWYKQRNPFTKLSYRYCTWSTCAVVSHAFTFICIRLLFSVRACVRACVCARFVCMAGFSPINCELYRSSTITFSPIPISQTKLPSTQRKFICKMQ